MSTLISNKAGFYEEISIDSGAYFNGVEYPDGETFVKAKSLRDSHPKNIFLVKNVMTSDEQDDALFVVKIAKIQEISDQNQEYLKTAFEYPVSSGNVFSVSKLDGKFQDYIALLTNKDSLTYPFTYSQNSDRVVLADEPDLLNFYAAAQTAFLAADAGRYQPAVNAIEAVTIASAGGYDEAIAEVLAVTYE